MKRIIIIGQHEETNRNLEKELAKIVSSDTLVLSGNNEFVMGVATNDYYRWLDAFMDLDLIYREQVIIFCYYNEHMAWERGWKYNVNYNENVLRAMKNIIDDGDQIETNITAFVINIFKKAKMNNAAEEIMEFINDVLVAPVSTDLNFRAGPISQIVLESY